MSSHLVQQKEKERQFLEQLLDGSKVENYTLPVPINADLRKYQQDGVNWLWFLNRYKLHGILCDDMGLGKTLMSLCILAGDHYQRAEAYAVSITDSLSKAIDVTHYVFVLWYRFPSNQIVLPCHPLSSVHLRWLDIGCTKWTSLCPLIIWIHSITQAALLRESGERM